MQLQAVEYGQVQTAGNLITAESHPSLKKFKHQKPHTTVWINPTYKIHELLNCVQCVPVRGTPGYTVSCGNTLKHHWPQVVFCFCGVTSLGPKYRGIWGTPVRVCSPADLTSDPTPTVPQLHQMMVVLNNQKKSRRNVFKGSVKCWHRETTGDLDTSTLSREQLPQPQWGNTHVWGWNTLHLLGS